MYYYVVKIMLLLLTPPLENWGRSTVIMKKKKFNWIMKQYYKEDNMNGDGGECGGLAPHGSACP
jgi:hypothetical protein